MTKSQFASRLRALLPPVARNEAAATDGPALLGAGTKVVDAFHERRRHRRPVRAQIAGRIKTPSMALC